LPGKHGKYRNFLEILVQAKLEKKSTFRLIFSVSPDKNSNISIKDIKDYICSSYIKLLYLYKKHMSTGCIPEKDFKKN